MIKPLILSFLMFVSFQVVGQELTATQNFPSSVVAGSEFTVEISINRGGITGFMKFYQELPLGFTATEIDSKGGSFTFADNGAKVVWIAPPNEATYTISYKVAVPVDASGSKTLTAKFSYINNNERRSFEFEPKTITIEGNAMASKLPAKSSEGGSKQLTERPASAAIPPAPSKSSTVSATANDNNSKSTSSAVPVVTAQKSSPAPVTAAKKEAAALPASKVPVTAVPSSSGKTYRVQIGAFTAKPKIDHVPDLSAIPLENGMTKYFSGDFSTMEEALKRKEEVSKKGFPGAFIVSFENGKIVK